MKFMRDIQEVEQKLLKNNFKYRRLKDHFNKIRQSLNINRK